jgi:hypothetical protein
MIERKPEDVLKWADYLGRKDRPDISMRLAGHKGNR